MPRSSRGLGRRPLTAVTRVQIPYGVQNESPELYQRYWLGTFRAVRSPLRDLLGFGVHGGEGHAKTCPFLGCGKSPLGLLS